MVSCLMPASNRHNISAVYVILRNETANKMDLPIWFVQFKLPVIKYPIIKLDYVLYRFYQNKNTIIHKN